MTEKVVGTGRAADIIALDGGRVLRQYREQRDVEVEARVMEHARIHGVCSRHESHAREFETRGVTVFARKPMSS